MPRLVVRLRTQRKHTLRIGDAVIEYVRGGVDGGAIQLAVSAPTDVAIRVIDETEEIASMDRPPTAMLKE